jgi:hypothetical protein
MADGPPAISAPTGRPEITSRRTPGQTLGDIVHRPLDGMHPPSAPARWIRSTRPCQAARTEFRNLPTSSLRRLLSPDSDCAAESTCEEAEPVSLAPR